MIFLIKLHTIKSAWSMVYSDGSKHVVSKNIVFLSLNIRIVLANSADLNEMPHHAAFHLGLHCFLRTGLGVSGLKRVKIG